MARRDLGLVWQGETYILPATKFFEVAEEVEEVFTLVDLAGMRRQLKLRKLSRAYGIMLRFAGASVVDQEVYEELSKQIQTRKEAIALSAMVALSELLLEGAPDSVMQEAGVGGPATPEDFTSSVPFSSARSANSV